LVCASIAVLVLVVAISTAAGAAQKGKVGGLPTRHLNPPDEGERLTPERVIAVGMADAGKLEVDAYGWQPPADGDDHEGPSVCTWIEAPPGSFPFYGTCFAPEGIHTPVKILHDSEAIGPKAVRNTQIGGPAEPNVARVVFVVRRPGMAVERVDAVTCQVSGPLQEELGQTAPFGYFYGVIRGNVRSKYVEAVAYDAKGQKLGSTRGLSPIQIEA
jgi:hypothetical protein